MVNVKFGVDSFQKEIKIMNGVGLYGLALPKYISPFYRVRDIFPTALQEFNQNNIKIYKVFINIKYAKEFKFMEFIQATFF